MGTVPATRPQPTDAGPPTEPGDVWDVMDKDPAGSPIRVMPEQVAPWVDHILFEKLRRLDFSPPFRLGLLDLN